MREFRLLLPFLVIAAAATGASGPAKLTSPAPSSLYVQKSVLPDQSQPKEIWIGEFLSKDKTLSYGGYIVEIRHEHVQYAYPVMNGSSLREMSYAVLRHHGRVRMTFNDHIYFGMGNEVRCRTFSFLDHPVKEIIVSQDVFRGGTQWIVSLAPRPRIIFNGPEWGVGRESDDMRAIDLDGDRVYEITLPITDFYEFQDKLPISEIPLPKIVFKYDKRAGKYLPANSLFSNYLLRELSEPEVPNTAYPFQHLGYVLLKTLDLIYLGRQHEAWRFYNTAYKLDDKDELRRRITKTLARQPVYKFIYNSRKAT